MRAEDCLLRHVDLKLRHPSAVLPLALEVTKVEPVVIAQRPTMVLVEVRYELYAEGGDGTRILDGSIGLVVVVSCAAEEWIEEMIPSVLLTAHNELRQVLHQYTSAMGLPPLVLDLAVIPDGIGTKEAA